MKPWAKILLIGLGVIAFVGITAFVIWFLKTEGSVTESEGKDNEETDSTASTTLTGNVDMSSGTELAMIVNANTFEAGSVTTTGTGTGAGAGENFTVVRMGAPIGPEAIAYIQHCREADQACMALEARRRRMDSRNFEQTSLGAAVFDERNY
jgi:hypothetical protein